ncbi:hypothetical protein F5Y07DRAFT_412866 [Xylaria sp. FL0933]|nr:hypothetical protein F5Y07DRAFT_412866 [Xylaria sp. FL0933]
MERLCQALITLALAVPALTAPAPGPVLAWFSHQVPSQVTEQSGYTTTIVGKRGPYPTLISPSVVPHPSLSLSLSSSVTTNEPTPTTELRKRDEHKCTTGDRMCHADLSQILYCNEDNDFVSYAECATGMFCHRLHMICVMEVLPTSVLGSTNSSHTLHTQNTVDDADDNKCTEGDRRCNPSFNHVDRCNSEQTWVTYHDCRKSETCDENLLECLPREEPSSSSALPGAAPTNLA